MIGKKAEEAIFLVGGLGTRLHPLTLTQPKPLLKIANHSIIKHQISHVQQYGVNHIVLATSYMADTFAYLSNTSVNVSYAVEETPLGTGGAVRYAANKLRCSSDDPVLIFNGDILTDIPIQELLDEFYTKKADVLLCLTRVDDPSQYGLVLCDDDGKVIQFFEKPKCNEDINTNTINAGVYIFKKSIIDKIPAGAAVSIERDIFPQLVTHSHVYGFVTDSYWLDLGTPQALLQGSADLVTGRVISALIPKPSRSLCVSYEGISSLAVVDGGSAVDIGVQIQDEALVRESIVMNGASIGARAIVCRSIIGQGAVIGEGSQLTNVVLADGITIPPGQIAKNETFF